jgi:hypothetical protein
MPTLKDQIEERTRLQHRLAIWEAIHHLMSERFLSKDGVKADSGIRVPNCTVELVPEETIEDVLQHIGDGPIADIRALIDQIEGQEVVVLDNMDMKAQA